MPYMSLHFKNWRKCRNDYPDRTLVSENMKIAEAMNIDKDVWWSQYEKEKLCEDGP